MMEPSRHLLMTTSSHRDMPKARHLLVERVREELLPPSPVNYCHDKEQPLTGVLSKPEPAFYKVRAATTFNQLKLIEHPKQECSLLNIQASGLLSRRKK
mmetsp:Transcript_24093/g.42776  ORF Transcript_24093/g.42776 Transcript_24093/m.42776 type:complete len:99 (-) Transcript_24093:2878-3174(-)